MQEEGRCSYRYFEGTMKESRHLLQSPLFQGAISQQGKLQPISALPWESPDVSVITTVAQARVLPPLTVTQTTRIEGSKES